MWDWTSFVLGLGIGALSMVLVHLLAGGRPWC